MAKLGLEGVERGLRASGESKVASVRRIFTAAIKTSPIHSQLDSKLAKYTQASSGPSCQPWLSSDSYCLSDQVTSFQRERGTTSLWSQCKDCSQRGSLLPGVTGSRQPSWSIGSWQVMIIIQHQPLVPGN